MHIGYACIVVVVVVGGVVISTERIGVTNPLISY